MKIKNLVLGMLSMIFLIGLCSIVYGGSADVPTPTLTTPAAGDTLIEGGLINITFGVADANDIGTNVTACALFGRATDTANSSWVTIINISNSSLADDSNNANWGDLNFSLGLTNASLEDSANWQLYAVCYNDSAQSADSTINTVYSDRTVPQTPTTSHTSATVFENGDTITYTVVGANTTGCRIAFLQNGEPPRSSGSNTYAMTHSANSCTYPVATSSPSDGIYDVYVRATDGTNITYSTRLDFSIEAFGRASKDIIGVEQIGEEVGKQQITTTQIFFWGGLFVIGYLFFFTDVLYKKKK